MQNLQDTDDFSAAQRLVQQTLEAYRRLPAGSQQRAVGEPLLAMLAGLQSQQAQEGQAEPDKAAAAEAPVQQQQNAAHACLQEPGTALAQPLAATTSDMALGASLANPEAAAAAEADAEAAAAQAEAEAAAVLSPASDAAAAASLLPPPSTADAVKQADAVLHAPTAPTPAAAAAATAAGAMNEGAGDRQAAESVDVAALAQLLHNGSDEDKIAAVRNLCKLDWEDCSLSDQAAVPAVVAGLVQMMGSSSQGVQEAAAGALDSLACVGEALQQRVAAVPGAVEGLMRLLGSSSLDVQVKAAWTLEQMMLSGEDLEPRIAAVPGAVKRLEQLLPGVRVVHLPTPPNAVLQPGGAVEAAAAAALFNTSQQLLGAVRQQGALGSADAVLNRSSGSSHLQSEKDSCSSKRSRRS
jgi:hypothetical protein